MFGYQHVPHSDGFQITRGFVTRETQPRWYLTDKYSEYLEDLMSSPHGTPTPLDESFKSLMIYLALGTDIGAGILVVVSVATRTILMHHRNLHQHQVQYLHQQVCFSTNRR